MRWNITQPWKRENPAICDNMDDRPWGHYVKLNKSDKDTYCTISLTCEIIKNQTQKQNMMVFVRPAGGKHAEMWFKECQLLVIRWISSRNLMYSVVILVNNSVLYTWMLLRVNLNVSLKMLILSRLELHLGISYCLSVPESSKNNCWPYSLTLAPQWHSQSPE